MLLEMGMKMIRNMTTKMLMSMLGDDHAEGVLAALNAVPGLVANKPLMVCWILGWGLVQHLTHFSRFAVILRQDVRVTLSTFKHADSFSSGYPNKGGGSWSQAVMKSLAMRA